MANALKPGNVVTSIEQLEVGMVLRHYASFQPSTSILGEIGSYGEVTTRLSRYPGGVVNETLAVLAVGKRLIGSHLRGEAEVVDAPDCFVVAAQRDGRRDIYPTHYGSGILRAPTAVRFQLSFADIHSVTVISNDFAQPTELSGLPGRDQG